VVPLGPFLQDTGEFATSVEPDGRDVASAGGTPWCLGPCDPPFPQATAAAGVVSAAEDDAVAGFGAHDACWEGRGVRGVRGVHGVGPGVWGVPDGFAFSFEELVSKGHFLFTGVRFFCHIKKFSSSC